MKKILFLSLSVFFISVSNAQKTVEGVKFSETYSFKSHNLVLNGAGLREKWFLDLYVAGLYVKTKTKEAKQIINNDEPVAMRLKIVSSMVTSEKMAETTKEGFNTSMSGDTKTLQKEIDQFIGAFKNIQLKEGDTCDLIYIPGEGLYFVANGKEITLVKGLEFKKALFRIWFGDEPADEDLKEELLKI